MAVRAVWAAPRTKPSSSRLRSIADVILVGAGTVRAENYGPPRISPEDQEARQARGQEPVPTIAVVSGRLHLDPTSRMFVDSPSRPIILTTEHADAARRAPARTGRRHRDGGRGDVRRASWRSTVCASGARRWCSAKEDPPSTVGCSPRSSSTSCVSPSHRYSRAATTPRVARGLALDPPQRVAVDRILTEDGFLFLRYLADR